MANTAGGPRVGILVVSDRRAAGEADASGPGLAHAVKLLLPTATVTTRIVPDAIPMIRTAIADWCAAEWALVLTTGGTGLGPRDVTPEATRPLIDRPAPGIVLAILQAGMASTPHAMLSRPEAGLHGRTLIINLPGSPQAALESVAAVAPALPHALAIAAGDPAAEAGHRSP